MRLSWTVAHPFVLAGEIKRARLIKKRFGRAALCWLTVEGEIERDTFRD